MNSSKIPRLCTLTIIFCLLIGCRTNPVYNVSKLPINAHPEIEITYAEIERAIVRIATSLGWSIKRVAQGELIAILKLRTHKAIASITFDDSTFSISYKESQNLKFDGANIHSNYNGWIKRLEKEITAELAALTRNHETLTSR